MILASLRKKVLTSVLFSFLVIVLNGCVYFVVGSVGVLGGYVISPDTVEGVLTGQEQDIVWEATVDVISTQGLVLEKNDAGGILIAEVQGAKVTVSAVKVSDLDVKLTVKARKSFLPKIRVAQDIYLEIERYLYE